MKPTTERNLMPENALAVKIASAVIYSSLGYTTYRVSRGIAWTLDKAHHRWKVHTAKPIRFKNTDDQ